MTEAMGHAHLHGPEHGPAQTGESGAAAHAGHNGHDHEAMIADFRRRFWVSLALTVPILLLSPMIQRFLGLDETLAFPGDVYVLFGLSWWSAVAIAFLIACPVVVIWALVVERGLPGA